MMIFLIGLMLVAASQGATRNLTFPKNFLFGAGSAAYQIEGAWNTSGKGESIWDRLTHKNQATDASAPTGDVAADSYHHYKDDVQALKEVGFNFYRFSMSWPRILPKGDLSVINQDGIDYYNNLINELVKNNIIPVVTMYHWDLPQHLQDLGGLANDIIVDYFEDYARLLFTHFGDKVKWWVTFNEPSSFVNGYSSHVFAPAVYAPGVGPYLVGHNVLKAHARVYHLYNQHFRAQQGGKISITLNMDYPMPKTNSEADKNATEIYLQFMLGWFAHPIYSKKGDYPAVMKQMIAEKSKAEGLPRSRLPEFSEYWVNYIRGTHDFYGMNLYTANLISMSNTTPPITDFTNTDMGNILQEQDPNWPAGSNSNFKYTPFAMRKMLQWISDNYNNVPILITENGWCDYGGINDTMRERFIVNYYAAVLDAIHQDNVTVLGYSTWALVDTFEWFYYSRRSLNTLPPSGYGIGGGPVTSLEVSPQSRDSEGTLLSLDDSTYTNANHMDMCFQFEFMIGSTHIHVKRLVAGVNPALKVPTTLNNGCIIRNWQRRVLAGPQDVVDSRGCGTLLSGFPAVCSGTRMEDGEIWAALRLRTHGKLHGPSPAHPV